MSDGLLLDLRPRMDTTSLIVLFTEIHGQEQDNSLLLAAGHLHGQVAGHPGVSLHSIRVLLKVRPW